MSIAAMKQAVEAMKFELAISMEDFDEFVTAADKLREAIASLEKAIAEAEKRDDTPAKAVEWVGLTDEEIEELANPLLRNVGNATVLASYEYFARAIEAKLKEKNT